MGLDEYMCTASYVTTLEDRVGEHIIFKSKLANKPSLFPSEQCVPMSE